MTTRTELAPEFRAAGSTAPPFTLDGSVVAALYLLVLVVVPEGNVISAIPMNLQPVLVIALGLGLVWISTQLVSTLGMAKGRTAVRTALFLYLSAHLVTYGIATRRYLVSDEAKAADSNMIKIFAVVGAAIFICDAVRGWSAVDRVVKAVTVAITIAATIGLIQFVFGFDPVKYMIVPGLRPLGVYDTIQLRSGLRRPAGTANHPIEFGMFCAMAVPLATHLATSARALGRPSGRWWLSLGLVGAGALVSVSRTAILCLAVAGVAMVIFAPGRRKLYIPLVGLTFFGIAGAAVPSLLGTLYNLVAAAGDDPSVTGRTQDYPLVWAQVAHFPWFGKGFGTYFPDRYVLLDNQYLGTLVENGYIGLAALVFVLIAGLASALWARALTRDPHHRSVAAALFGSVAVVTVGAVTFDLLAYALVTGLLFGLVGISGAALRAARADATAVGRGPATRTSTGLHS